MHLSKKFLKKEKSLVDKLIYGAAVIAPAMTAPQAYTIWQNKSAENISIATWVAFLGVAIIWFVYGLLHKEKPVIMSNGMVIIMDIWLIAGALIYS